MFHSIRASDENSKMTQFQRRKRASRYQKAKDMWLLLCHTQNLKVMKIQQCPQVFNLPFKMNLYLLDQVIKRQEKWKKKIIRKTFSTRIPIF